MQCVRMCVCESTIRQNESVGFMQIRVNDVCNCFGRAKLKTHETLEASPSPSRARH